MKIHRPTISNLPFECATVVIDVVYLCQSSGDGVPFRSVSVWRSTCEGRDADARRLCERTFQTTRLAHAKDIVTRNTYEYV